MAKWMPTQDQPKGTRSRRRANPKRRLEKAGIITQFAFKIFTPGNTKSRMSYPAAPAGKGYTPEGMQIILSITLMELHKTFPRDLYRIVQTGAASVSFVWDRALTAEERVQRQEWLERRNAEQAAAQEKNDDSVASSTAS